MADDTSWSPREIFGGIVGGLILAGLGLFMFMNPDAGAEMTAEGRRGLVRMLLEFIWSDLGGVVLIILGLGIVALTIHQIVVQRRP